MKRILASLMIISVALSVLLIPSEADAKPHQLTYVLPTTDCDGAPLAQADLIEQELIYSQTAMPMPSDTEGSCSEIVDPEPPAGSLSVAVPAIATSVILNLQPGQEYFARIRISAYLNGNWSSWSNQAQFTVPYGRPNVIRLSSNMLDRMEYWEIDASELKFFGS